MHKFGPAPVKDFDPIAPVTKVPNVLVANPCFPGDGRKVAKVAHWELSMPVHFELVDLRLLVSIAEANSLTHGAERAHLSLPAVSKRIKHLEESLGTALFYRTSQGVMLTPPGQAFVHHARLVLLQLEHLYCDLREYVQGVKGHVRVLANTTASIELGWPRYHGRS